MKEKLVQAKPPGPSDGVYLPQGHEVIGKLSGVTYVRILIEGNGKSTGGDGVGFIGEKNLATITGK